MFQGLGEHWCHSLGAAMKATAERCPAAWSWTGRRKGFGSRQNRRHRSGNWREHIKHIEYHSDPRHRSEWDCTADAMKMANTPPLVASGKQQHKPVRNLQFGEKSNSVDHRDDDMKTRGLYMAKTLWRTCYQDESFVYRL